MAKGATVNIIHEPHDNEYGRLRVLRRTDGQFVVFDPDQWPPDGAVRASEVEARFLAARISGIRIGEEKRPSIMVTLTLEESRAADAIAVSRQKENLAKGREDAHGADPDPRKGLELHVQGARGERAVAKLLGRPHVKGRLRDRDVGHYEVRTGARATHRLIVHPHESDDAPFIFVAGPLSTTSSGMTFEVQGWIVGKKAKQPAFWKDPAGGRAAFFVPREALLPMHELPRLP